MRAYQLGIDLRSYPSFSFFWGGNYLRTRTSVLGAQCNGINERTCGSRAHDVCDACSGDGGLTRACTREGMLNRCAADPCARSRPSFARVAYTCVQQSRSACVSHYTIRLYYHRSRSGNRIWHPRLDPRSPLRERSKSSVFLRGKTENPRVEAESRSEI